MNLPDTHIVVIGWTLINPGGVITHQVSINLADPLDVQRKLHRVESVLAAFDAVLDAARAEEEMPA